MQKHSINYLSLHFVDDAIDQLEWKGVRKQFVT